MDRFSGGTQGKVERECGIDIKATSRPGNEDALAVLEFVEKGPVLKGHRMNGRLIAQTVRFRQGLRTRLTSRILWLTEL